MEEDRIFALDIGTRKILGLVMQRHSSTYRVLASEMIEHRTRAMYDGQIHDVEAVAETIREVKEKLEEKLQIKLESAAVAAAGRALKTARGKVSKDRANMDEISAQEVRAVEIEAVQQAQYQLAQSEAGGSDNNYICAGYSVVEYRLEGQELASLVGQVGSGMEVEIIATFLPRVVVDSLLSALRKIDLGIFSMTLEPIAALSVAIPPEMRLLNLVLVDIGAGTSDIAVVKENTIFAYAMVPFGGDELTEHIAGRYLLDFNAAEQLKRQLSEQEEVDVIDILGNQTRVASSEVIETLQPVIDELAASIAEQINTLNQKSPDAVICIGGGSLTPGLPGRIAQKLDLPVNRVGIRTPDRFYHIEVPADYLKGPQGVTPLGIAYNSFTSPPVPFIKVRVNEREVALWNIGELSVGTALLNSGIALNNIFGKPGLGKTITVNGQVRQFKGELGGLPHITVNGREEQLETPIHNGDRIEFRRGQDGKPAIVKIKDLLPFSELYVTVNGEKMKLKTSVYIDDRPGHYEDEIPDRARVDYRRFNSLADILAAAGVPDHILTERIYRYYLNGQENMLRWRPLKVTVNGREGRLDQNVDDQADIQYTITQLRPRLRDILGNSETWDLNVLVNDKKISLKGKGAAIFMNERIADLDHEIEDEARINIDKTKNYAILSDVLGVIDVKRSPRGRLIMRVDGQNAGYTTPIFENSVVEFFWKE